VTCLESYSDDMDVREDSGPLRPRQLIRDQVFHRLAEDIISGRLQPLEDIKDHELQNEFGISRTPIREALLKLRDLGLVEMRANSYTRVAPIDFVRQAERTQTASALISFCAAESAGSYTPEQESRIVSRIDDLLASDIQQSGMRDGLRMWYSLYALIVAATGNRIIVEILNEHLAIHLTRMVLVTEMPSERAQLLRQSLLVMRDAVVRRDGEALRQIIVQVFDASSIRPLREYAVLQNATTTSPPGTPR